MAKVVRAIKIDVDTLKKNDIIEAYRRGIQLAVQDITILENIIAQFQILDWLEDEEQKNQLRKDIYKYIDEYNSAKSCIEVFSPDEDE